MHIVEFLGDEVMRQNKRSAMAEQQNRCGTEHITLVN